MCFLIFIIYLSLCFIYSGALHNNSTPVANNYCIFISLRFSTSFTLYCIIYNLVFSCNMHGIKIFHSRKFSFFVLTVELGVWHFSGGWARYMLLSRHIGTPEFSVISFMSFFAPPPACLSHLLPCFPCDCSYLVRT